MAVITGRTAEQYAQVVPAVANDVSFEVGVQTNGIEPTPRGKLSFTGLSNADIIMYRAVRMDDPSKWEVGKVAYDGTNKQLDRLDASVIASSNSNNTVDFTRADGTKSQVFVEGLFGVWLNAAYTITNHVVDRTMDANSAADLELADVIGTVISDLIDAGILTGSVAA